MVKKKQSTVTTLCSNYCKKGAQYSVGLIDNIINNMKQSNKEQMDEGSYEQHDHNSHPWVDAFNTDKANRFNPNQTH